MKRTSLFAIALATILMVPMLASAQLTSSGTLAVTATVQSSMSMVFTSQAGGVALTGSGTNNASMAFGNISAFGGLSAGVSRVVGASSFTVSSPFNVEVDKSNVTSPNYTLTAQLASTDATNTWALGGTAVTGGSAASITASGAYGSAVLYTLNLTVPFASAGGAISNTINFVATPN